MSDANRVRIGSRNQDADDLELFRVEFTGMVLEAFDEKHIMNDSRQRVRRITSGKAAEFANTGKATAEYHVPGTEISGDSDFNISNTILTVDDLLISHKFLARIEEAMNHFDVRAPLAKQMGVALARQYDRHVQRVALQAAVTDNPVTGLPGGTDLIDANFLTNPEAFAEGVFAAHQTMIEKDVDMEGVFCVVKPDMYFRLVQNKDLLNRDWGGVGSYGEAELPKIAGIPLVMSNFLPQEDDTAPGSTIHAKYRANYSNTAGVVVVPDAVGTVKLLDMAMEIDYSARHQGTFLIASMACGHGVLSPAGSVRLGTTALTL